MYHSVRHAVIQTSAHSASPTSPPPQQVYAHAHPIQLSSTIYVLLVMSATVHNVKQIMSAPHVQQTTMAYHQQSVYYVIFLTVYLAPVLTIVHHVALVCQLMLKEIFVFLVILPIVAYVSIAIHAQHAAQGSNLPLAHYPVSNALYQDVQYAQAQQHAKLASMVIVYQMEPAHYASSLVVHAAHRLQYVALAHSHSHQPQHKMEAAILVQFKIV